MDKNTSFAFLLEISPECLARKTSKKFFVLSFLLKTKHFWTPLFLLKGSFDCNGLYQWLPLRGVQSESSVGGETHARVNREHRWWLDVFMGRTPRAAAVPPDSALEFPPFLFLYSLLTSLLVFLIPYFLPDVSDSFMICCRLSFERKKMKKKKKHCQNKTVWLYVRKHARNFVSPNFYFDKFFCICCVFLLTVFLCFYCTHAVTDDAEKDRERERERRSTKLEENPGFV